MDIYNDGREGNRIFGCCRIDEALNTENITVVEFYTTSGVTERFRVEAAIWACIRDRLVDLDLLLVAFEEDFVAFCLLVEKVFRGKVGVYGGEERHIESAISVFDILVLQRKESLTQNCC